MILGKKDDKNGNTVVLRTPSMRDLERLTKHMNNLVDENADILVDERVSLKYERAWLKDVLRRTRRGDYLYVIAERGGEIMGTANFAKGIYRQSHVAGFGVSVGKKFRKLGIGTLLAKEIFKHARKKGVKIITLGVFPGNKIALSMYKKLGFKKYGLLPKSIRLRRVYTGEILMYKNI